MAPALFFLISLSLFTAAQGVQAKIPSQPQIPVEGLACERTADCTLLLGASCCRDIASNRLYASSHQFSYYPKRCEKAKVKCRTDLKAQCIKDLCRVREVKK